MATPPGPNAIIRCAGSGAAPLVFSLFRPAVPQTSESHISDSSISAGCYSSNIPPPQLPSIPLPAMILKKRSRLFPVDWWVNYCLFCPFYCRKNTNILYVHLGRLLHTEDSPTKTLQPPTACDNIRERTETVSGWLVSFIGSEFYQKYINSHLCACVFPPTSHIMVGHFNHTHYATTNRNRKGYYWRRELNKTKSKQHKEADLENREYNNQPPPGQVGLWQST